MVEAYETVAPKSSAKRLRALLASRTLRPHAITFTSSSTVKNFVELAGIARRARRLEEAGAPSGRTHGIHRPVTSATLREFGLPVDIEAKEYTIPGLVAAIVEARSVCGDHRSSRQLFAKAVRSRAENSMFLDFGGEARLRSG